jgi:hypothetical protein
MSITAPQPRTKKTLLNINEGDVVHVVFPDWMYEGAEWDATVVSVTKRYGAVNEGRDPVSPLLKLRKPDGTEQFLDAGYVHAVVSRSKKPAKAVNHFLDSRRLLFEVYHNKDREWTGSLGDLVSRVLATLPYNLDRQLDWNRMLELYNRTPAGLLHRYNEMSASVRPKPFRKWVRANYSRLMKTTAALNAEHTRANMEYEQDYWKDYEDARRDNNDF